MSSRPRTPCRWSTSPAPTKCILPCHTKTRSATRRARPTACSLFPKSLNENINAKTQRRRVATRFIFFASYHLCAFALKIMLNQFTISELTAKLATREVSAREATQACLDQIQRVDGKIHALGRISGSGHWRLHHLLRGPAGTSQPEEADRSGLW